MNALYTLFGSFVASLILIVVARRLFPRFGLMDRPQEYGMSRPPIPYSGGVIFFIIVALSCLLFLEISPLILGVLIAGGLITFVSFLDDRYRISPLIRLAVQILAGLILIWFGLHIQIINNPFFGNLPIHLDTISFELFGHTFWLLSSIFIIGWLVLMMNVMNWLDGIPGLTSGVSTIAQISLLILASRQFHVVDQSSLIFLSSVLAGSTAAFLIFDFSPPKILMGDSGSMFLGFMLGSLSLLAGGKLATALLIMGFPVLDAFFVILRRMMRGQSPLKGDYTHFHHRLLHAGLSQRRALIFNYILCTLCASVALLLGSTYEKVIAFLLILASLAVISVIVFLREKKHVRSGLRN